MKNAVSVAISLALLSSCMTHRSVMPGPGFIYVKQLERPAQTRVFTAGQHGWAAAPAAVHIANMGFSSGGLGNPLEAARREGQRLGADFVVVYHNASGAARIMGISAYRILPARLGFLADADGVVREVHEAQLAEAGLRPDDRILSYNGVPWSSSMASRFETQPGDGVTLELIRDGQMHVAEAIALPNPPMHLDLPEPESL